MSGPVPQLSLLILLATAVISVLAFRQPGLQDRLIFSPEEILIRKQWYRLISSGFLHADWLHLLFNGYSLYLFGRQVEFTLGPLPFAGIYFLSILGGNLLSLFLHRHHSSYRALGASGGVCGVIFASIFLLPGMRIFIFPLPVAVPSWLYAILFVLASSYGLRTQRGNIGHDAHLGGAIVGLLTTTAIYPQIIKLNPILYPTVLILSLGTFLYLTLHPLAPRTPTLFLPLQTPQPRRPRPTAPPPQTIPDLNLDTILDKISQSGMESLTPEEHEFLRKASRQDHPR